MTCDCLEPDFPCSGLRSFWLSLAVFLAAMTAVVATVRFLTDFDIGILHSISGGSPAAPPKPHLGARAGGAGSQSERSGRPGLTVSTARIAADCQSFLQGTLQGMQTWSHGPSRCDTPEQEHQWPRGCRFSDKAAGGPPKIREGYRGATKSFWRDRAACGVARLRSSSAYRDA